MNLHDVISLRQRLSRVRSSRAARLTALGVLGVLGAILVVAAALTVLVALPLTRHALAGAIASHLGVDASLDRLSLSLLPAPRLIGRGLRLRVPNAPDLPPFIEMDEFVVRAGLLSLLHARVDAVHLTGLRIVVPPADERPDLSSSDTTGSPSRILISRLEADDSRLTILRRATGQDPVVFEIHHLEVDDAGYARAMTFQASVTNPTPLGLVTSNGTLGPWRRDDPAALPVKGDYQLSHADLNTITGLGGTLTSTGRYAGRLNAIHVTGTANVPDFSLDLGGAPVPLTSTFEADVDATDGTTVLDDVNATLISSPIHARGAIRNLPGPGNHDVTIDATVTNGRIEDVLRLAVNSPTPLLVGALSLHAHLALPPGAGRARRRLRVTGAFGLEAARFTNARVQHKVRELSRRSRAIDEDDPLGRVLTDLAGSFTLAKGVLSLSRVTFQVPGASVGLAGTYALDGERLNFTGTLRMDATVSQAVGGFKSIFLKPFDFLFRKNGSGAVVPIRITGTRKAPKMSVRLGKVL